MEISKNLGSYQLEKVGALLCRAGKLGMDVSGYGKADENPNSGYVYLWLEDYNFTLYIDIPYSGIFAMWTHPEHGAEEGMPVLDCTTLAEINNWVASLDAEAEEV
jgi:hypothetical protein